MSNHAHILKELGKLGGTPAKITITPNANPGLETTMMKAEDIRDALNLAFDTDLRIKVDYTFSGYAMRYSLFGKPTKIPKYHNVKVIVEGPANLLKAAFVLISAVEVLKPETRLELINHLR